MTSRSGESNDDLQNRVEQQQERIDELEQTVKKMMPSRRDMLKGGAVAGAGLLGFGAGQASADGHSDGDTQWGSNNNRDDYFVDYLNANTAEPSEILTPSREPDVVVYNDGGTVKAVSDGSVLASGDAATPADVASVVQAAIDAGGLVVGRDEQLDIGAYTLNPDTNGLTVRNLSLIGDPSAAMFKHTVAAEDVAFLNCSFDHGAGTTAPDTTAGQPPIYNTDYNSVEGFRFEGTELKNSDGTGLFVPGASNAVIAGNRVKNTDAGIQANGDNVDIVGNVLVDVYDGRIVFFGGTSSVTGPATISGNVINCNSNGQGNGVDVLDFAHEVTVSNNTIRAPPNHGVNCINDPGTADASPSRVTVSDNTITRTGGRGVMVNSPSVSLPTGVAHSDINVEDNTFVDISGEGVRVMGGTDGATVQGNHIDRDDNTGGAGITLGSVTDVSVRDNRAKNANIGINLDDLGSGAPKEVVLVGNDVRGNATPVRVNTTNATIIRRNDNPGDGPFDVRTLSPDDGATAVHDGSGSNTPGPAWYNASVPEWESEVDGSTIS